MNPSPASSSELSSSQTPRPPIVVIVGHIDHGKTTILDWFRKTKIAGSEAGGITQHIGAYEIEHQGKKLTFIDTPGHEAFSQLRSRGAKIADLAILAIAADEGMKPQTREALEIIREYQLPFVVALTKVDKGEANTERVRQELATAEVFIESYGGKIPCVEISAREGTRMEELLETLLIMAELDHLVSDAAMPTEGVVIEAHRDPRRGITATLIVRNGVLRKNDFLVVGSKQEIMRIFENFRGERAEEISASAPALVAGLAVMPGAGDIFRAFPDRASAAAYQDGLSSAVASDASALASEQRAYPKHDSGLVFPVILKADVAGSREALETAVQKLSQPAIAIRILKSEIGDVTESDVKQAITTQRVTIVGFKVRVDPAVQELADQFHIQIIAADVIYHLLNAVTNAMRSLIPPEVKRTELGQVKILRFFKKEGQKQIVGGRVEEGTIQKGARCRILRFREARGEGMVAQLQQNKRDVERVEKGLEFGALIESKITLEAGDVVQIFLEETIAPPS